MVLIDATNYSTVNTITDFALVTNQTTNNLFWILFSITFTFILFTVFANTVGTKPAISAAFIIGNIANVLLMTAGIVSISWFFAVFFINGFILLGMILLT